LGWVAKRDLDKMCEDSWRWQMYNPDGYTTKNEKE
jgi:UDP-glucose 4-epimerase